jgi:hypothetical protein
MDYKKNVFVVLTEYQFLQAVNLATAIYSSSEYINSIYIVLNGLRFKNINENSISKFNNITFSLCDFKLSQKEIANLILWENPNHFFFFQTISNLNIYLSHTLSKRGVEISLGPDGYKVYANYNKKHYLLSVIKDSFKHNLNMIKNNIFSGKVHLFDYYRYGYYNFIDNLWITHPEKYYHKSKNKVNILKLPKFNKNCIDLVKIYFYFNINFPTQDAIYFFNQPLWGGLIEKEVAFLENVLHVFPSNTIVLKLHPLTDLKTKEKYNSIEGLTVLDSSVPAEVLLLSLKNCIVYSGWSTVLITENPKCNYYFNFPIYKALNDNVLDQTDVILLNHITTIKSPEEMKFPND